MKLLLPFVSMFLFAGCLGGGVVVPTGPFDPSQIYRGYPCRDECEGFKKGYETAQATFINEPSACTSQNDAERLGCKAFVTDYRYATTQDAELVQNIENQLKPSPHP